MNIAEAWKRGRARFPVQWHGALVEENLWFSTREGVVLTDLDNKFLPGHCACTAGQILAGVDGEVIEVKGDFRGPNNAHSFAKRMVRHFPWLSGPARRTPGGIAEMDTIERAIHELNRARVPSWQIVDWLSELENETAGFQDGVQHWSGTWMERTEVVRIAVARANGTLDPENVNDRHAIAYIREFTETHLYWEAGKRKQDPWKRED